MRSTSRAQLSKRIRALGLLLVCIALVITLLPASSEATVLFAPPLQAASTFTPRVAIHVSELTQALESMPASAATPNGPGTSGYQWWVTAWHYFTGARAVEESLRSDGTPFVTITDAEIGSGQLLNADGSPKYPIVISLASEASTDSQTAALRTYVNAGGFLFVGSSAFTRYPDGTTRGDFALANEMGLHMASAGLQNWYENTAFAKLVEHRLVSHIPSGTLSWPMPLTSEESTVNAPANHLAWRVVADGAQVIATGSNGPLLATKTYGAGQFIYYGPLQPLIGHGGFDMGTYAYVILRRSIEWAFEAANLPIVKLSPWRYPHDSALVVRHDLENFVDLITAIETSAQYEHSLGVKGDYFFCTGVLRAGSEDTQLTPQQKANAVAGLQRAVSLYGASIGSHNGGLPNPNESVSPASYTYWHWGPDEVLNTNPPGYANGKQYALSSIERSFTDIEGWLAGRDNGRVGCGVNASCPRIWVSPAFNSTREDSYDLLEQINVKTTGEQKIGPFPHWTVSTQTSGRLFSHLTLPLSEWFVGQSVAQSLDSHTSASIREGVDFYYGIGGLVNFYGHSLSNQALFPEYLSYTLAKPRIWSANAVAVYDWWVLRSPVVVTPTFSRNGTTAVVSATIANATDSETAIELVIPSWSTGAVSNVQVLFNGVPANPVDYRTTNYGIKIKVGSAAGAVEVRYDMGTVAPTATPTATPAGVVRIGETGVLSGEDTGNGNLLAAQQAVLAQSATIQSLSFYVTRASGQLRLGIYSDAGGRPGTLQAQTAAFTPVVGWNTQNVLAPVSLPAGTYWLAYLPQNNTLGFRVAASGLAWGYSYAFAAMPGTAPSATLGTATAHWSLYATLLTNTTGQSVTINVPSSVPDSATAATDADDASTTGGAEQTLRLFLPLVTP